MKPVLLIDMDGVIADYQGAFLRQYKARHPDRIHHEPNTFDTFYIENHYPEDFKEDIFAITRGTGFFESILPMPGALGGLANIVQEGHFEPFLCTAPDYDYEDHNCASEKTRWVEKYLGNYWLDRLILTKDKTVINGQYLIDDKPVITGVNSKPSWNRIVFHHPYNTSTKGLWMQDWDDWANVNLILKIGDW
jgi:5'-nucleotidase